MSWGRPATASSQQDAAALLVDGDVPSSYMAAKLLTTPAGTAPAGMCVAAAVDVKAWETLTSSRGLSSLPSLTVYYSLDLGAGHAVHAIELALLAPYETAVGNADVASDVSLHVGSYAWGEAVKGGFTYGTEIPMCANVSLPVDMSASAADDWFLSPWLMTRRYQCLGMVGQYVTVVGTRPATAAGSTWQTPYICELRVWATLPGKGSRSTSSAPNCLDCMHAFLHVEAGATGEEEACFTGRQGGCARLHARMCAYVRAWHAAEAASTSTPTAAVPMLPAPRPTSYSTATPNPGEGAYVALGNPSRETVAGLELWRRCAVARDAPGANWWSVDLLGQTRITSVQARGLAARLRLRGPSANRGTC